MIDHIRSVYLFAKTDFLSNKFRFCCEIFAWALSISTALIMAITVPNPPLQYLYPMWILGCSIYGWAAWSRRSFGMLANYLLLVTIDLVGLFNIIMRG